MGGKGADKLWLKFVAAALPAQEAAAGEGGRQPALAIALQSCAAAVPKKTSVPWAQLVATISQLEENSVRGNPAKMIRLVVEAGYDEYLQENYPNYSIRLDDLEQLAVFSQQFADTADFLSQLALLTNLEAESDTAADRDTRNKSVSRPFTMGQAGLSLTSSL